MKYMYDMTFLFLQMMGGLLQTKGFLVQTRRVRESLNRVDGLSVAQRRAKAIKRRHYRVPMSNSLWHIDGHMKLIR